MGNVINVKLTKDRNLEITEKLVRDFQEQVSLVDLSMSGLVKTLDSLRVSCELFLRQVDSQEKSSRESQEKGDNGQVADAAELVVRLLKTISESVSDQKRSAVECLTKLLHSVLNIGMRFTNVTEEDTALSLDEYRIQNDDDLANETPPYYETRVELLRNELTIVKKLYTQQNEQIAVLNKKDELLKNELDIMRKRIEILEQEKIELESGKLKIEKENHKLKAMVKVTENIKDVLRTTSCELETLVNKEGVAIHRGSIPATVKQFQTRPHDDESLVSDDDETQLEKIRRELQSVTAVKESLESEMNKLKSKECIHVQIRNKGFASTPISELVSVFKSEVETPIRQLHIIELEKDEKWKAEFPLMVFVNTNQGLQDSVLNALDNLTELSMVALVVVHRLDSSSSVQASEYVLLNKKFKQLAGIFDVVFNFKKGFYSCDINNRNFKGLADFIEKKGVRKSALETYGLC